MVDKKLISDFIAGLEASLKELQGKKEMFLKAKGLNEESEKLLADAKNLRDELAGEKAALEGWTDQKNRSLVNVTGTMARRMNAVLASGSAVIEIREDGSFFIGWNNGREPARGGATVPYAGLSGGERAAFDPALCKALGGSLLVVEAAEIDDEHLTGALRKYEDAGLQVIVSSCHSPETVPLAWRVVRL